VRHFLRHELLRRSVLFAMPIVASTVVGIFSIPILVSSIGAVQWGSLAVMQVITQFFAVIVAFGWGATGPSMVSALPPPQRKAMYTESLFFRVALFAVAAPLAVAFCVWLPRASFADAALATLTYVVAGLSAAWYLVGTNRPVALFVLDALPAILGQILGLVIVLAGGGLTGYLVCTAAFALAGACASAAYILTRPNDGALAPTQRTSWSAVARTQAAGVSSTISASLWTAAPIVLVQALAPTGVPVWAMVDRLMKYGVLALAPILQAVQGWVPESGVQRLRERVLTSIRISLGVGALGGIVLAALSTPISSILGVGQATVPWALAAISGVTLMAECVAQVTGLSALVALGGARQLAASSIASAVVGIPMIAVLIYRLGIYGAAIGTLLVACSLAVYRIMHTRRLLGPGVFSVGDTPD